MLHMELSRMSKGSLNRECGVRPPGSKIDAIPEDATANAIFPLLLIKLSKVVHRKVFPVPPYP